MVRYAPRLFFGKLLHSPLKRPRNKRPAQPNRYRLRGLTKRISIGDTFRFSLSRNLGILNWPEGFKTSSRTAFYPKGPRSANLRYDAGAALPCLISEVLVRLMLRAQIYPIDHSPKGDIGRLLYTNTVTLILAFPNSRIGAKTLRLFPTSH